MKNEQETDILTLTEVSKMLRLHPNTLRKYDDDGILKAAFHLGKKGTRRYRRSDVEDFIQRKGEAETK